MAIRSCPAPVPTEASHRCRTRRRRGREPGGDRVVAGRHRAQSRHLTCTRPARRDIVPIALTIATKKDITPGKIVYPQSETLFFAPLSETVLVYQKPFRLTRPVTLRQIGQAGHDRIMHRVRWTTRPATTRSVLLPRRFPSVGQVRVK